MVLHAFKRSQTNLLDLANDVKEPESYEKAQDIARKARVYVPDFDQGIDPQVVSIC